MDLLNRSLILLVLSPVLILVMHIMASRATRYFKMQVPAQKLAVVCIVLGNLPMGLLVWFLVLQFEDYASRFWGFVYSILVYNMLGHIYFHLFNLTQTGIRATVMREIAAHELTFDEIVNRYDPSNSGERLQRLQELSVVTQVGDRYFLQTQWLYYIGVICRAWGNLLGFGEKDNGYPSSVK